MENGAEPNLADLQRTDSCARLIFGPA